MLAVKEKKKVKATQVTKNDIDRLLQRAADYFAVSQSWHIEVWDKDTTSGWHTEMHLVVFWSGCLLEENVEGGAGSFVWGTTIEDYWYMTEDGEWHRYGNSNERSLKGE